MSGQGLARSRQVEDLGESAGTSASQKTQNAVIHEWPYLRTERFEFAANLFNNFLYITSMLVFVLFV